MNCAVFSSKYKQQFKNSQQYYTTKCLTRDLLSDKPNCYVCAGKFRRYLFTGKCATEVSEAEIDAGNLAIN